MNKPLFLEEENIKFEQQKVGLTLELFLDSGSGYALTNWATYVMIDFSSGLSTSTSERRQQKKLTH